MRKIVTAVGVVAVLGIGAVFVINNSQRTGDQRGRVGAALPVQTERAAPVPASSTVPPRAAPGAPASTPTEAAAGTEPAPEAAADEHGPFGHGADRQLQADQATTAPDSPAAEATGDATSLAPLLSDTRVRLEELLADAAEPGAADELASLLGARAPIEALLDNPDPAVREEAAALLQLLAKPAP